MNICWDRGKLQIDRKKEPPLPDTPRRDRDGSGSISSSKLEESGGF
jgi:hypothetical protein